MTEQAQNNQTPEVKKILSTSQILGGVYIVNKQNSNQNRGPLLIITIFVLVIASYFGYNFYMNNYGNKQVVLPIVTIQPTIIQIPTLTPTNIPTPLPTTPVEESLPELQEAFDSLTIDDYADSFQELDTSLQAL